MAPNIVLLVCDTLRKDMLGIYGGKPKTPNLDKFAKDAMVYEHAIAPSPWTFPSHVSIFTGMYPNEHGVHEAKNAKLTDCISLNKKLKAERIQSYLKKRGYTTMAISNNWMVSRVTGFDLGFDRFLSLDTNPLHDKKILELARIGVDKADIIRGMLEKGKIWLIFDYAARFVKLKYREKMTNFPLDKGAKLMNKTLSSMRLPQKLFLFINMNEMHEPYVGEDNKKIYDQYLGIKKIDSKTTSLLKKQYMKEVEYTDKSIGELISILKKKNLYDDSIIIVTSDHGQALNEHGYLYHARYLFNEIIEIPLLIKYPNNIKFRTKTGYQNLAELFPLVKDILSGKDDSSLTKKASFSESYGNTHAKILPQRYLGRKDYLAQRYDKHRKCMLEDGFKLTLNLTDNKIEEFLYNGEEADLKANRKKAQQMVAALRKNA